MIKIYFVAIAVEGMAFAIPGGDGHPARGLTSLEGMDLPTGH